MRPQEGIDRYPGKRGEEVGFSIGSIMQLAGGEQEVRGTISRTCKENIKKKNNEKRWSVYHSTGYKKLASNHPNAPLESRASNKQSSPSSTNNGKSRCRDGCPASLST